MFQTDAPLHCSYDVSSELTQVKVCSHHTLPGITVAAQVTEVNLASTGTLGFRATSEFTKSWGTP